MKCCQVLLAAYHARKKEIIMPTDDVKIAIMLFAF
jgi:hypothetical protein